MNSYPMFIVAVFLYTSSAVNGYGNGNRILLKDIQAITLTQGLYTNGRRSAGVPHLQCVGGSAGCYSWKPSTVQCYNRGSDGYDIQWECKSEMPSNYKFGAVAVSCEGFDHPDDPYVLAGSCGLEYSLEFSSTQSSSYYHKPGPGQHEESKSSFGTFLCVVAFIVIVVAVFYSCMDSGTGAAGTNPGSGYRSTQAPPPGFRSDFYPNSGSDPGNNCGSGYSSTFTPNQNAGTGGGGFWTGAATGGLFGYMMGSNNARNQNQGTNTGYGFQEPSGSSSSSFRSSGTTTSAPSSSTHTSSGFGGTKRR